MRTLTMNEVQDVNGAGAVADFLIGLGGSAAWDGIKAVSIALWDMRNNEAGDIGEFYNLRF